MLEQLLNHPCLTAEDRPSLEQAVAGLRSGLDFADALHHASCRDCEAITCFDDRGFARRYLFRGWDGSERTSALLNP